ncbi:PAS domain-containing protein [Paragemmobacter straminiformis]|nr:PAS domain-containing protein [Gemmobacter straminiformis]
MAAVLRAHWQRLRKGEALPRRDEFAPRELAPVLSSMFLIEGTERGAARFLIAGRVLCALYGMELRGAPLALLFEPAARGEIAGIVAAMSEDPATVDLTLRAGQSTGRPALLARMTLLPLANRAGTRDLAIGTMEVSTPFMESAPLWPNGEFGQAPRRFGIERCLRGPLRAGGADAPEPPPRGVPLLRLVE